MTSFFESNQVKEIFITLLSSYRRTFEKSQYFHNRPFSYSTKGPGLSDIFKGFIRDVPLDGVRASIAIVHIRKFHKM